MECLGYFKALSDKTRVRLFYILSGYELSVNELVTVMGMGQSRISRHLRILTDCGLLQCRRDGVWAFYSVLEEGRGNRFAEAVYFLFQDDSGLKEDLANARRVVSDRESRSKQFFNSIAHEWDDLQQQITGDFDLNNAILGHVEQCELAVDMGCGTGKLLHHLKDFAKVAVGVDSSPVMLQEARKRFHNENGNVKLRLGELEHLPIAEKEADCVIISMALHHLSHPVKAISEAARILRKKGRFIIADFEKHSNEEMRKKYGDRWLGFSKEEISTLLKANRFKLVKMETCMMNQSLALNIFQAVKK